ncbi:hypothetical protein JCM33374_g5541 [Metschnikowia sp. JCM 33374]|nr:hypothetical protein JCM33374_g5541 [Metschnikowia sp. JCM 33374]
MTSTITPFETLASHKIVGFPDGNIISWCPQMDLLAVSMNLTSIWVFRLDGERVYSINNRAKILHLQWSHSGKFFVLSGTDNAIKVYDSNNGKLVNQFATSAALAITLVSWASINVPLSIAPDGEPAPYQDLFRVDILDKMPKLANEIDSSDASSVSTTAKNAPYTSVSVTNTTDNDGAMDYLLVVSGDSCVSVTFNNLFTVSGIMLPKGFSFLKHGLSTDFFHQSLLVRDSASQLHLQDFRIDVTGPRKRSYFFDAIRWASQVISITNHINDQFRTLQTEAQEFLVLYDRYLSNYKDALYADVDVMTSFPSCKEIEEKLVVDLGNMLLTGLVPSTTKDYWLNQLGDRGLIRLSTIGNNVYDNVRKVMFTQLILGSEKLIILLSYLESLSNTAEVMKEENYGISLESVKESVSVAQSLVKKIYGFIWRLNDEHEYFNQFLNWAKVEVVEKLSKEDNDPESFFAEHPTMDFKASSIMEYFSDFMFDSVLMSELDLDCSQNETLKKKHNPDNISVKSHITKLQNQLKTSLAKMEDFLAQKVIFEPAIPLNASSDGIQSDLEVFGDAKIITSVTNRTVSVTTICGGLFRTDIHFPGRIICHKLLCERTILILYEADETTRKFELFEFEANRGSVSSGDLRVLKSLAFDATTVVKKPAYMTINGIDKKSNIMALVLDESKKDYIIIRI